MFARDVEMFIEHCENKGLATKTIGSYEQTLRLLMLWLDEQGITQTEKITHVVIQDYVKQIKERGKYTVTSNPNSGNYQERRIDFGKKVSDVTINNYLRNMSAFFNWCVEEGLILRSPVKRRDYIKVERRPLEFVSDEDFRKLLRNMNTASFSEYRDYIIIQLLLDTGMRINECLMISKNGQAQLADGSSTLNMGYEGNKSVYALRISPRDEWANLTISAYWHTPNKEITPPATLFANNVANVPAIVTAISGEGKVTFQGIRDGVIVTSADVPYTVGENSGTEMADLPDAGSTTWEQLIAATQASADAARKAQAATEKAATGLEAVLTASAAAHNGIFRGKNLGSAPTEAQLAAIKAGTFDDLYVGDYWSNGGVNYRIAAFDYYLKCGDTSFDRHHAVIVPDTQLYTHNMNATNTTEGGYVNSLMRLEGLAQAKEKAVAVFGADHVLTHRVFLTNAVTNGKPSGGAWFDSDVELMNENMVYGSHIFAPGCDGSTIPTNYTVEKSQLPLFQLAPHLISNRQWFWLRDVVSSADFAFVGNYGGADYNSASAEFGVRPDFPIG